MMAFLLCEYIIFPFLDTPFLKKLTSNHTHDPAHNLHSCEGLPVKVITRTWHK